MTADELKNKVVEAFDSKSLLKSLVLDASSFRELPRLFENAHLAMRITLNDQSAMAVASSITAKLKRDLQQLGIELEYVITTQWKLTQYFHGSLQRRDDGSWMLSDTFDLELQSGYAKRLVTVRIGQDGKRALHQYLSTVPAPDQPAVIHQLVETWLNQQLESIGLEHWDPILYPTRTIRAQDIAGLIQLCKGLQSQELQPQLD